MAGLRPGHSGLSSPDCSDASVLVRGRYEHAGNVTALEGAAGGFGLAFVEACEARPIKGLIALHDLLGERVGLLEDLGRA
jgi:hypothetical protein